MEIVSVATQEVAAGQDVLFTNTVVCGNNSISHRSGSGLISLRGLTNNQCRARYRAFFSGNIAVPAGGTAGAIQLSISLNGEAMGSTTMIYVPAAVGDFGNVSSAIFIDVPRGCCDNISVRNTSTVPIEVANANLIIERVA